MLTTSLLTALLLFPVGFRQADQIAARFDRAVELQRQGEWEKAAAEYRALLKLSPIYAEAQANLGAVLSRLGKYDEAVGAYESALRLDPKLTPILLNLGIAHYRAGAFAKAAEALDRFLAVTPDHVQAHQLRGISLVELGQYKEAVEHLASTLDRQPDDLTVLYYAGIAYLSLDTPKAEAVIGRLAAADRGKPLALMLQAQIRIERFEFAPAAAILEEAARLASDLPRLQGMLGLVYYKLGRGQQAIACFQRELKRSPNDFQLLYYLAEVLEKQGDLTGAHGHIRTAIQQEPQSPQALTLLSQILFKLNQPAEALAAIDKALAVHPADTEKRYLRARILQRLGRKTEAAREMTEVQRTKESAREQETRAKSKP